MNKTPNSNLLFFLKSPPPPVRCKLAAITNNWVRTASFYGQKVLYKTMHLVFCYWSWISPWQCCFTVYIWIVFCIWAIFTPCHCKHPISVLFWSLWFWIYLLFNIFVVVIMKVGCLEYPGACTGSQLAPWQSNPRNPAMMSPHPGPAGTHHTEWTVEKGEGGVGMTKKTMHKVYWQLLMTSNATQYEPMSTWRKHAYSEHAVTTRTADCNAEGTALYVNLVKLHWTAF